MNGPQVLKSLKRINIANLTKSNSTAANIVYTIFGASGSKTTRVTFDCTSSEVQHRMPNIAYTARYMQL